MTAGFPLLSRMEATGTWWSPWSSKPVTRPKGVWWVRFPSASAIARQVAPVTVGVESRERQNKTPPLSRRQPLQSDWKTPGERTHDLVRGDA